jgi:hypothetical protein
MKVSPYAVKPAEHEMLVNVLKLITDYFTELPKQAEQMKP